MSKTEGKAEKAQKPTKPTRYFTLESFKKAPAPKIYTPLLQPRGYRVELLDWGNGLSVSIAKFVPGKGIRGVAVKAEMAEEVLGFALELLKKALE